MRLNIKELHLSLTKPYHGAAVDAFYEYLEQNQKDFSGGIKYYARYCSIVQSSGTGKTRLMLELAKKGVLVLYINLRPKDDRTGFPLRDSIPADILTGDLNTISANHYEARCCAFFASVFKTIVEVLSVYVQEGCPDPIKQWNDRMCDLSSPHRTRFFARLLDVYNEVYKSMAQLSLQGSPRVHLMTAAYADMLSSLPWLFTADNKPKLALALDEAHPLHEETTFYPATILCCIISMYSGQENDLSGVWVVFASTTSKVVHFAPPRDKSNSARVTEGGELVFAPFSQLGWDQHAEPLNATPATDVAKLGHIIGYGRPLWTSLKAVFDTHIGFFDFAGDRLCGVKEYHPAIQSQALAFLDQRFGLDICFGHRHAVEHVESSVASHLCVGITTTEDRAWSYTTYPSEPFLSVIAANLLHRTNKSLQQILAILKAKVDDGMIDIGQSGELASRLLWLLAKDLFVRIGQSESSRKNPLIGGDSEAKDWDAELIDCKMVSVTEFFEFLFGEDFWSRAPTGAKTAFQDAYINFSHWVSMDVDIRCDDEDQLDFTEWTSRHWQRTCAVQCCHNQPSIDKVIPIYFKSLNDDSTDHHRFSQILILDKAQKQATTTALQRIMRTDPSIAGPEFKSPFPYIAILADMGLDQPGWRDSDVSFPQRTSGRVESDGQCLRIHARGIDPKTYAFLGGTNSALLNALRHLVERETVPAVVRRPLAQYVQDQVRYGNSGSEHHMHWERGSAPAPQQR
ncbi:hypothetical protein BDN67DRAFT_1071240 [Paxillus ammoniavirescens]|nr:hypothetical protein BDN67DRAFT_1071240 [Paxillus ammoniavirescens]